MRRALDLHPTGLPEAIRVLLSRDGVRIAELGAVWEPAAGLGDLRREIEAAGLPYSASDIADQGWPSVKVWSFNDFTDSPAAAIVTNPRLRHGRPR